MSPSPKYQVYPSLLNTYHLYLTSEWVSFEDLINQINRVPKETTMQMQRGIDFEDELVRYAQVKHETPYAALFDEMLAEMPSRVICQRFVEFQHKDIRFYGYTDFAGFPKVIDVKTTTTSKYCVGKYLHNHQNLYLYALKSEGFREMSYLITDFDVVYKETYSVQSYDFSILLAEMELFAQFLEEHRHLITDRKVFNLQ